MGELKEENFGINYVFWFMKPKNDRDSDISMEVGNFLIAWTLPSNSRTPSPEISKSNHSISF